jgi:hypothetical protein
MEEGTDLSIDNRVTEFTYSEPPSIEPGVYPALFNYVEAVDHARYGLRWRWYFVVRGAAENGEDLSLSKWTSPYLSRKSKANEIVRALRGKPLERGETLAGQGLEGRPCQLVVSRDDEEGWNRIDAVLPPAGPKLAKAKPAPPAGLQDEFFSIIPAQAMSETDADEAPPPTEPPTDDELVEA